MRMRLLILLVLSVTVLPLFGQTDYFQRNERGNKIGAWPEFYKDGSIKTLEFYIEPEGQLIADKAIAFQLGIRFKNGFHDTTIYWDNREYTDYYEYNSNSSLYRIKRVYSRDHSIYLYGSNQEIGVLNEIERLSGIESETQTIKIQLYNFTEEPIQLHCGSADPEVSMDLKINLPPNDTTVIAAQITLPHGEEELFIQLKNPSISIGFEFEAYGYTLTSKDFQLNDEIVVLEPIVQYHRTGNEAKLSILNYLESEVVLEHSLAKRKSEIDLKELKPGKYWIEIVDFSSDKKIVKPLKLDY